MRADLVGCGHKQPAFPVSLAVLQDSTFMSVNHKSVSNLPIQPHQPNLLNGAACRCTLSYRSYKELGVLG